MVRLLQFTLTLAYLFWTCGALAAQSGNDSPWWQKGVVYQIYPRSFQDTNGDGIGDLNGITARLDYLADLGIDAIWISPFYPSPMKDFGYDIANFTDIDSRFGDLADFDLMISEIHKRGLKLIMDFVPNHTSDQHPWFMQSRASKNNPKRDWYIWRSGRTPSAPPNNWRSVFGGSAWQLDPETGEYYYHAFLKEQPDLNWHHPDVRSAMLDAMKFWLSRGVDGFRVDAVNEIAEDLALKDEPKNPAWNPSRRDNDRLIHIYTGDQKATHGVIRAMRKTLDSFSGERVLITESYRPFDKLVEYYGTTTEPEAHMPFNFHLIGAEWKPAVIAKLIKDYESSLPKGAWPDWVEGNHDNHRLASRIEPAQTRVAAMLLLTLRGTPTIYNGDELGLKDVVVPPEAVQDPVEVLDPGKGFGRDPSRAPMIWDQSDGAGFSKAKPWLPIEPQFKTLNVAMQAKDPKSILSLYKALLKLRRNSPELSLGSIQVIEASKNLLAYRRKLGGKSLLVVLNFSARPATFKFRANTSQTMVKILSTGLDQTDQPNQVVPNKFRLMPHEGVIFGDLAQ